MCEGLLALAAGLALCSAFPVVAADYAVVGDAIPAPLTSIGGDPARGRELLASRQVSLCLLCHGGPDPQEPFQGSVAPALKGIGARMNQGQIRMRIVEPARVNPETIMPAYLRSEGFERVAPAFRGKAILSAQQIEDIVAYLATLR